MLRLFQQIWLLCFLFSCSSPVAKKVEIGELLHINEIVAKKNHSKLTTKMDGLRPTELTICVENRHVSQFFYGKILLDYHFEISNSDLHYESYVVESANHSVVFSFDVREVSIISMREFTATTLISNLKNKRYKEAYDAMDVSIQAERSLNDFVISMEDLSFGEFNFLGFVMEEGYIEMAFEDDRNIVTVIYELGAENQKVFGISVDGK